MQTPDLAVSGLLAQGRVVPMLHSIGVLLCIVLIGFGAISPTLAADAGNLTIIAAALGGTSGLVSAYASLQSTRVKQAVISSPSTPPITADVNMLTKEG